jgi:iron/zinc/copper transport system permease protein
VGGLYASYYLNAASGSTIVLAATAFFFLATAFSPKRRSLFTALVEARANAARSR